MRGPAWIKALASTVANFGPDRAASFGRRHARQHLLAHRIEHLARLRAVARAARDEQGAVELRDEGDGLLAPRGGIAGERGAEAGEGAFELLAVAGAGVVVAA